MLGYILRLVAAMACTMVMCGDPGLAAADTVTMQHTKITIPASTGTPTAVVHLTANSQTPNSSKCAPPGADSRHWYVDVYECGQDFTEVSATATLPNPRPKTDGCNAEHSNGQITLEGSQGDQTNDIELSWVSYPVEPDRIYLQVGRGVGSQKGGLDYPSSDWEPYPSKDHPNLPQPLAAADIPMHMDPTVDAVSRADFDAAHLWRPIPSDISNKSSVKLRISYVKPASGEGDGQWQIFVDDKEIGYYWDKKTFGPSGFQPKKASWWGEAATTAPCSGSQDGASCTGMGNGKPGTYASATEFSNMATVPSSKGNPSRYMYVTNPDLYTSDKFDGRSGESKPFSGTSFKYGGPGACAVPPTSDSLSTIGPKNFPTTPVCAPGQDLVGGHCVTKQTGCEATGYRCSNRNEVCRPDQERGRDGHCYNKPEGCDHDQYWDHGQCKPNPECDHNQVPDGHGGCIDKPETCEHDQYWDHGTCKPNPAVCNHDQIADGHGGCVNKPQGQNECRHDQVLGHDGKCYDKPKDCPHGQVQGPHGACPDTSNNGNQNSGSNNPCPNGMVRVSPETDTTSGCVLPNRKQQNPQKQDHPNTQQKQAEPNQQTNHKNPTQEKNNSGQSGSSKNDQKKKCDPHQEKCTTQR